MTMLIQKWEISLFEMIKFSAELTEEQIKNDRTLP